VFELLKRHLYLEVSAIAMIDLDDHIFGSQNRFYQGIPVSGRFRGKEAHRVRFALDRTLESIGRWSPTEIGLLLGLGLWGKTNRALTWTRTPESKGKSGSHLDSGSEVQRKIGLSLGLGLWSPRPVGLWFGLGLLVCSGLGFCGRVPPLLSRHWDRQRASPPPHTHTGRGQEKLTG
jgi:hypothetical protein